jgi:hypothetical protein
MVVRESLEPQILVVGAEVPEAEPPAVLEVLG